MAYTSPPPTQYNKPEEKHSIVDTGLEISSLVLTTLEDAARFAPVPYLQDAASLALSILNMVATTKGNREAFRAVANDACELVCVVVKAVRVAQERGGIEEESDLMRNVRQLIDTLTSIDNFTRKEAHRNVVSRFVRHQSDLDKIEGYRRRLQKSLDIFGLQSNISISDNLSRVVKQQNELLSSKRANELNVHASTESPTSTTGATGCSTPTSHASSNPFSQHHPLPTHPNQSSPTHLHQPSPTPQNRAIQDPFGFGASFAHFNPTSNFKYTEIGGNMTRTDNSDNISNVNSGNTTTTTITDAYNTGYDRLGARGNRAARRANYH